MSRSPTTSATPRVAFGPDVGWWCAIPESVVRARRMDCNGAPLDSVQIDIDGLVYGQWIDMPPGVAWGGQNFLVVWAGRDTMKYALVAPDGSVTARAVLQDEVWRGSYGAAVVFDGTNFLVSWIGGNESLGSGSVVLPRRPGRHSTRPSAPLRSAACGW